jgi:hypothetical protein
VTNDQLRERLARFEIIWDQTYNRNVVEDVPGNWDREKAWAYRVWLRSESALALAVLEALEAAAQRLETHAKWLTKTQSNLPVVLYEGTKAQVEKLFALASDIRAMIPSDIATKAKAHDVEIAALMLKEVCDYLRASCDKNEPHFFDKVIEGLRRKLQPADIASCLSQKQKVSDEKNKG